MAALAVADRMAAVGSFAGPVAPMLAVRRAPALDPPYEGQLQPPAGMQLLPLDWSSSPGVERSRRPRPGDPSAAEPPDSLRPEDGSADENGAVQTLRLPPGALPRPPATPARPLPPGTARAAAQRFVSMCVEVLNGFRPAAQLRPVTAVDRFNDIADQLVRRATRVRLSPGQAARQGRLLRVRRMVLCEPRDGVAEAAVVLEQGRLCWAMALRLERSPEGWRCTVVQVV